MEILSAAIHRAITSCRRPKLQDPYKVFDQSNDQSIIFPQNHDDIPAERRIKAGAAKLTAYPFELDTLVNILQNIIDKKTGYQQSAKKPLIIKASTFPPNTGYSRKLREEMLQLAGFVLSGDSYKVVELDLDRLQNCKKHLETQKKCSVYRQKKQIAQFEESLIYCLNDRSREEAAKRAEFALRVPPAPVEGSYSASIVHVYLGRKKVSRLFNGDDMLSEVIMWVGSHYGSIIPEKLQEGVFELVNNSTYPPMLIDYQKQAMMTLYSLVLTPSAELQVQLAGRNV